MKKLTTYIPEKNIEQVYEFIPNESGNTSCEGCHFAEDTMIDSNLCPWVHNDVSCVNLPGIYKRLSVDEMIEYRIKEKESLEARLFQVNFELKKLTL